MNIDIDDKWKLFLNELKTIKHKETKRYIPCCDMLDVDLHEFGDALRVTYREMVYVKNFCRHDVKVSL